MKPGRNDDDAPNVLEMCPCRLNVNRAAKARLQEATAERYVRQRVPGHRAKLHDDADEDDERSALGLEDKAADEGEGHGDDVDEGCDPARRRRHVPQLPPRPDQEAHRDERQGVAHGVLGGEGRRVAQEQLAEGEERGDGEGDTHAEAEGEAEQALPERELRAQPSHELLGLCGLDPSGVPYTLQQRRLLCYAASHAEVALARHLVLTRLPEDAAQHAQRKGRAACRRARVVNQERVLYAYYMWVP